MEPKLSEQIAGILKKANADETAVRVTVLIIDRIDSFMSEMVMHADRQAIALERIADRLEKEPLA